jgi:hypothetical protein
VSRHATNSIKPTLWLTGSREELNTLSVRLQDVLVQERRKSAA